MADAPCPGCGGVGPGLPYVSPPERLAQHKPASLFAFRVATEGQVAAGDWRCLRCTQRRHAQRPLERSGALVYASPREDARGGRVA